MNKKIYKVWIHSDKNDTHTEEFETYKEGLECYKSWIKDIQKGECIELSKHKNEDDFEGEMLEIEYFEEGKNV